MGKKVSSEVERHCQMVDDLTLDFEERSKQCDDGFGLERARHWFSEAIKQGTIRMYENIVNMLESAIFHMEEANRHLKKLDQSTD